MSSIEDRSVARSARRLSRRQLIGRLGPLVAATGLLAACAQPPAPSVGSAAPTAAPAKPTAVPSKPAPASSNPTPAASKPAEAATKPVAAPTSAPAAASKAVARGRLTWGVSADVARLNPQMATYRVDTSLYDNMYDQLTRRDAEAKLVPGLATEWQAVNDTTWQFKLRPNVKFHNGDPLTAADVKFTIERTYNPDAKTVVAQIFDTVAGVEVVDDLTVNFVMKQPDPLLPARHAYYGGYILPAKYFQQVGPDEFEKKPIGTGPYKFVEWRKDDHLTLEAFADYWGGAPNAEQLIVRPMPEASSRVAALLAGDINFADEVPPDQVQRINASGANQVASAAITGANVLFINALVAPLNKKEVRQALSLAIDRQAIVNDLLLGLGRIPNGSIPQGDFAYNPSLPPIPHDNERAKELLRQGGYAGEEIAYETLSTDLPVGEAIVAMWKTVGVNAKIEVIENPVRAQKMRDKSFKGVYPGVTLSTLGDPDGLIWRLLGPGGSQRTWTDEEFDRLGQEAHVILDENKRRQNYERINAILNEHVPWIVIYQPLRSYGMHRSIRWQPYPSGRMDFRAGNLSFSG